MGVTTGTLAVQIEKLTKAELIERCPHPADKRVVVVTLTDQGEEIYLHHNQLHMDLVEDLSRHVTPEQEEALLNELEAMNREF